MWIDLCFKYPPANCIAGVIGRLTALFCRRNKGSGNDSCTAGRLVAQRGAEAMDEVNADGRGQPANRLGLSIAANRSASVSCCVSGSRRSASQKKGPARADPLRLRSKCRETRRRILPLNSASPEVSRTFGRAIRKGGTEALINAAQSTRTLSPAPGVQTWVDR
jgi:hypothetical protein